MPLASDPTIVALSEAFERGELSVVRPDTAAHPVRLPNGVTVYVPEGWKPDGEEEAATKDTPGNTD